MERRSVGGGRLAGNKGRQKERWTAEKSYFCRVGVLVSGCPDNPLFDTCLCFTMISLLS